MVSFVRKRLQVFVSSTNTDLVNERRAAVEAILTAGHIPAGMEIFTSGDESQMEVINQWIGESDVYLLILGGRYGSIEPKSGKSYTQIEYDYAVERGKPLFACVITDAAREGRVKTHGSSVIETDHPQELKAFRAQVLTRMVRFWEDAKDIKIAVGETLAHFARRDELIGWVRAGQEANMPALADEIARLSKENAQLRNQIAESGLNDKILGLRFDDLCGTLEREGLLTWFLANRSALNATIGSVFLYAEHRQEFDKLTDLGLVKGNRDQGWSITDAGRTLLNRWQFAKTASDDAGNPDDAR